MRAIPQNVVVCSGDVVATLLGNVLTDNGFSDWKSTCIGVSGDSASNIMLGAMKFFKTECKLIASLPTAHTAPLT